MATTSPSKQQQPQQQQNKSNNNAPLSQFSDNDDFLSSLNTFVKKNEKGLKDGTETLFLNPACLESLSMFISGKRVSFRVSKSDLLDLSYLLSLVVHLKIDSNRPEVLEKYKEMNLAIFKCLRVLELTYVKPALIINLLDISKTLTKIIVHESLYSLDEMVIVEDEEKLPGFAEMSRKNYDLSDATEIQNRRFQEIYQRNGIWSLLKVLDCSFNYIPKIDTSAFSLSNLEKLNLEGNLISKIENLQECISLRMLNLSFNRISTTETIFETLGCVSHLSLNGNLLTTVDGLNKLYGLEYLDVGRNKIQEVEEIFKLRTLPHIKCLIVEGNPLCEIKLYRGLILCSFFEEHVARIETIEFYLDNIDITMADVEFVRKYSGAKHASMSSFGVSSSPSRRSTKIKPMSKDDSSPSLLIAPTARITKQSSDATTPSKTIAGANTSTSNNNVHSVVGSVQIPFQRVVDFQHPDVEAFEDELDNSGFHKKPEDKFVTEKDLKEKIDKLRAEGGNAWLKILNEMQEQQNQKYDKPAVLSTTNEFLVNQSSSSSSNTSPALVTTSPAVGNTTPKKTVIVKKKQIKKIKKSGSGSSTPNSQDGIVSSPAVPSPQQQASPQPHQPPKQSLLSQSPSTNSTTPPINTVTPTSSSPATTPTVSKEEKEELEALSSTSRTTTNSRPKSTMYTNSTVSNHFSSQSSNNTSTTTSAPVGGEDTTPSKFRPKTTHFSNTTVHNSFKQQLSEQKQDTMAPRKGTLKESLSLAAQSNVKLLCEPFFVVKYSSNQDLLLEIKSDVISETHPTTGNSLHSHLITSVVFIRKFTRAPSELVEITFGKEFKDGVPVEFTKEVYIMENLEQADLLLSVLRPLLKEYTMSCMDCTERYTCRQEFEFTQCVKCHSRFLFFVPQSTIVSSTPVEVSTPTIGSLSSTPTFISSDMSRESDDDFNFRMVNDQNLQLYFRMNLLQGGSKETYIYMMQSNYIRYNTQEEERSIYILLTSMRVYLLKRSSTIGSKLSSSLSASSIDPGFTLVESYSIKEIRRVSVGLLYQFFRFELEDVCYVFLKRSHDAVHKFLDLFFEAAKKESIPLEPYFKSMDTLNNINQLLREKKEDFELYIMLHQKVSSKNLPRSLIITKEKIYLCQENFVQYPLLNNYLKTSSPQFTVVKSYKTTDVSSININRSKSLELTIIFDVEGESKQQWQLTTSHVTENRKVVSTIKRLWKKRFHLDLKVIEQ
ncbi:hypothetical protein DFA_05598 [Cavenderia fasciculata]|uniref:Leucine-rich repeat-containing protein n=1 Tax=Cavenderia fasciculata TaxID=261658 RepID=F4PLP3_CACFS|nr:uncharacterized protein DFA_05598 [Cavenderia fasciculata]EGG23465.1 hypothetical protein DFA_05598 [Cavenderia fasciculata]|eukprot:XP_004361316.1 hypothetical protein DFA_05598 [Cavenderia fasciculata]